MEVFRPAELKIDRAKHHINDLDRQVSAYLAQNPMYLATRCNAKTGEETHFIKQDKPIPEAFSLIIGDAVHNLRSALDLTIFWMLGDKASDPSKVQFPFSKRADTLVGTIKNRQVHLAGENVVAAIESLQPYPGGNEWLEAVHSLDITDKHKLIITAAAAAMMPSIEFARMLPALRGYETVSIQMDTRTSFVTVPPKGSRRARRAYASNIRPGEYKRDVQPTFEICFGEAMEGRPVVPCLAKMAECIEASVHTLLKAYSS